MCIYLTHNMITCWHGRGGAAGLRMRSLQGDRITFLVAVPSYTSLKLPMKLQCNTSCLPPFIRSTPVNL